MALDTTTVTVEEEIGREALSFMNDPQTGTPGSDPVVVRFTFSCGLILALGKILPEAPRFTFLSPCCGAALYTLLRSGFFVGGSLDEAARNMYSRCRSCGEDFPSAYPSRARSRVSSEDLEPVLAARTDALAATILAPAISELATYWGALPKGKLAALPGQWNHEGQFLSDLLRVLP